ncbi:heparinase II/III family protein [Neptuniibacter sp. QD48_55]|uniref:heparinase II/III family protein n=1 Tax=Neptuniibacter sp. QD48_55 TaxID=3398212 RepID=UPI0039F50312
MSKLSLLFHTIRHLKLKQIIFQLYYRVRRLKPITISEPQLHIPVMQWEGESFRKTSSFDGDFYTFLNIKVKATEVWKQTDLPKLWLYNLHYHDDLSSDAIFQDKVVCEQLISNWIENNPPVIGDGWEPYCLSLRAVNWIKWFSGLGRDCIDESKIVSLAYQVTILERQIEYHIFGNHLFVNAKALVFAGVFFSGTDAERWLRKGLAILDQEIKEQFLPDGGHFELSPMYHASLIWDLCELINLGQKSGVNELSTRISDWGEVVVRGVCWLKYMVHPDGQISFFNDSAYGVAPTVADIERYAKKLKLMPDTSVPLSREQDSVFTNYLENTGYYIIDWAGSNKVIIDMAEVGPAYQPGHAHADTLSLEWSVGKQRVLVNSGTSVYGVSPERLRQRQTSAHNTVVVNDYDSSEVWGGFRVARRAQVNNISSTIHEAEVEVCASHDGYHRFNPSVTHTRRIHSAEHELRIVDHLSGNYGKAYVVYHIHPDAELVKKDDFRVDINFENTSITVLSLQKVKILDSSWHPEFGLSIKNKKLVIYFSSEAVDVLFKIN